MASTQRPTFIIFGSSIVQFSFTFEGFSSILSDLYVRRADIKVRGYAGWNSTRALGVIKQVFPLDAEEHPALVIVYFGGNDSKRKQPGGVGPHVPLPEYISNMGKIIDHLQYGLRDFYDHTGYSNRGCASTLMITGQDDEGTWVQLLKTTRLLFLSTPAVNVQQIIETYKDDQGYSNETCGQYSAALVELCNQRQVQVVDLWKNIQRHPDWEATVFLDGIHFNNVGAKIVMREIMNVLRYACWEPSLFWTKMHVEFSEDSLYDEEAEDGQSLVNASEIVYPWQKEWDF